MTVRRMIASRLFTSVRISKRCLRIPFIEVDHHIARNTRKSVRPDVEQ